MKYGLIYTVPFATTDNVPCVVEIEKEGYTGECVELIAGETPFTTTIEDEEFLYVPTRFSTAKLTIVGNDYLQSLFSTSYRQYRATLKVNGEVSWCGFIKPELYTQDFTSETFVLEIECMSAMSVLEFIDYTVANETKGFVSLWSLLQRCIEESRGLYNYVYIPYVYAKDKPSYEERINVIAGMMVSEQDFFDEEDKPMKLKEVLMEICKFLNWTCVDWKGDLYFLDIDYSGVYHKYDVCLSSKSDVHINELSVQNIGFMGSNHSLDILPGYNKATVRCSNYPVGELLPQESFSDLLPLKTTDDIISDNTKVCHIVYLMPQNWNCILYKNNQILDNKDLNGIIDSAPGLEGAMLAKYCVYEQERNNKGEWTPKITDYAYENVIRIRYPESTNSHSVRPGWYKALTFRGASATYIDGAIAVSGAVKILGTDDLIPWGNSRAGYGKDLRGFQIRIGDYYYGNEFGDKLRGFSWEKNPDFIVVLSTESWNNDGSLDWVAIPNEKTLDMPYSDLSGLIIPITSPISGDFEFSLLVRNLGSDKLCFGEMLKDFSVKYKKKDGIKSEDNSDRVYENVLNENYINELDEIEFKISSYNDDGACYSKVMLDGNYLTDNLYNVILDKAKRPEEMLITRIINHYSSTRMKLTQTIKNNENISPFTVLSDTFLVNKKFINAGGTIDYKMNRFECIMIEI